jgi:hypothetical protein
MIVERAHLLRGSHRGRPDDDVVTSSGRPALRHGNEPVDPVLDELAVIGARMFAPGADWPSPSNIDESFPHRDPVGTDWRMP